MITNSTIGTMGQLGNQLFQYAFLFGQSARQRRQAFIDADRPGFDLEHFHVETGQRVAVVPGHIYAQMYRREIVASWPERSHLYSPEMAWGADGCDYAGYFQSSSYFDDCASELRKVLRFRRPLHRGAARWKAAIESSSLPVVSVHVRRGDYLLAPRLLVNLHTTDYYERALAVLRRTFPDGFKPVIFSDDIGWCESSGFLSSYPDPLFIAGTDRISDLYLMSQCHHHVIANSSFSWWGAWLSTHHQQLVIAPREWFGPDGNSEWHTIYRSGWIVIESRRLHPAKTANPSRQSRRVV
ncbi:MAG: alpha-1,2-fucosyltransferase [Thermomicrobiales bacterium]